MFLCEERFRPVDDWRQSFVGPLEPEFEHRFTDSSDAAAAGGVETRRRFDQLTPGNFAVVVVGDAGS